MPDTESDYATHYAREIGQPANPTHRQITGGVHDSIAGSPLAFHLQQINQEFGGYDPELKKLVKNALSGEHALDGKDVYRGIRDWLTAFEKTASHGAETKGDPKVANAAARAGLFARGYNWHRMQTGLRLDRALKTVLETRASDATRADSKRFRKLSAAYSLKHTDLDHLNDRHRANYGRFWSQILPLVTEHMLATGAKKSEVNGLTNDHIEAALARLAYREGAREKADAAPNQSNARYTPRPVGMDSPSVAVGRGLDMGGYPWKDAFGYLPPNQKVEHSVAVNNTPKTVAWDQNPQRFRKYADDLAEVYRYGVGESLGGVVQSGFGALDSGVSAVGRGVAGAVKGVVGGVGRLINPPKPVKLPYEVKKGIVHRPLDAVSSHLANSETKALHDLLVESGHIDPDNPRAIDKPLLNKYTDLLRNRIAEAPYHPDVQHYNEVASHEISPVGHYERLKGALKPLVDRITEMSPLPQPPVDLAHDAVHEPPPYEVVPPEEATTDFDYDGDFHFDLPDLGPLDDDISAAPEPPTADSVLADTAKKLADKKAIDEPLKTDKDDRKAVRKRAEQAANPDARVPEKVEKVKGKSELVKSTDPLLRKAMRKLKKKQAEKNKAATDDEPLEFARTADDDADFFDDAFEPVRYSPESTTVTVRAPKGGMVNSDGTFTSGGSFGSARKGTATATDSAPFPITAVDLAPKRLHPRLSAIMRKLRVKTVRAADLAMAA